MSSRLNIYFQMKENYNYLALFRTDLWKKIRQANKEKKKKIKIHMSNDWT